MDRPGQTDDGGQRTPRSARSSDSLGIAAAAANGSIGGEGVSASVEARPGNGGRARCNDQWFAALLEGGAERLRRRSVSLATDFSKSLKSAPKARWITPSDCDGARAAGSRGR